MRRVLLLVLLASCGVEATKALTPASSAKADPALIGTWKPSDKEKDEFVINVTAKGALVRVELTGDKEPMLFEGHVSVLAPDVKILNLRSLDAKANGNVLFVRYAVNADGSLETWLVSDKHVKKALDAGTLKGSRGSYGGVTLDETPEKITAFLLKEKRDEVFEKLATFKKK